MKLLNNVLLLSLAIGVSSAHAARPRCQDKITLATGPKITSIAPVGPRSFKFKFISGIEGYKVRVFLTEATSTSLDDRAGKIGDFPVSAKILEDMSENPLFYTFKTEKEALVQAIGADALISGLTPGKKYKVIIAAQSCFGFMYDSKVSEVTLPLMEQQTPPVPSSIRAQYVTSTGRLYATFRINSPAGSGVKGFTAYIDDVAVGNSGQFYYWGKPFGSMSTPEGLLTYSMDGLAMSAEAATKPHKIKIRAVNYEGLVSETVVDLVPIVFKYITYYP